jgi:hypothetical protein
MKNMNLTVAENVGIQSENGLLCWGSLVYCISYLEEESSADGQLGSSRPKHISLGLVLILGQTFWEKMVSIMTSTCFILFSVSSPSSHTGLMFNLLLSHVLERFSEWLFSLGMKPEVASFLFTSLWCRSPSHHYICTGTKLAG